MITNETSMLFALCNFANQIVAVSYRSMTKSYYVMVYGIFPEMQGCVFKCLVRGGR